MAPWRNPFLIAAFSGWGDASSVATTSAAFLLQKREVTREIEFDPEEHFVLTDTRPTVRLAEDGSRRIQWPSLALMHGAGEPRDLGLLLGPEPQLRWRGFVERVAETWERRGEGGPAVLLGAFLASVPHTGPVFLTGFATTRDLRAHLSGLGVQPSGYEGPTSIHSVLAEALRQRGVPCASVWAAVPHYVGSMPNPKACVAVLRVVDDLLGLSLDLTELEDAASSFEKQVSRAINRGSRERRNRDRPTRDAAGGDESQTSEPSNEPLPSPEEMIRGVEEFLKKNRPDA